LQASLKLLERLRVLLRNDPNVARQQAAAQRSLQQLDARKPGTGKAVSPKQPAPPQKSPVLPNSRTP